MKKVSPKVNLIFSIGALVLALSLSVFVIFGWFLLSSATTSDVESNVVSENCSAIFTVNGAQTTNKLVLDGAMPGIEFEFEATVTNTSGKAGYITVDIFYQKPIVGSTNVDMRKAFFVRYYGVKIGDAPTYPSPVDYNFVDDDNEDKTVIKMIAVSEVAGDNVSLAVDEVKTIKFSIFMRTGETGEDMNVYQGQEFKIDKLEIKVVPVA